VASSASRNGTPAAARGRLITLEGGEGTGKSTQAARLATMLRAAGLGVVVTREPGGAPAAERIRTLILAPADPPFRPLTEALLHSAARCEHVRATLAPALAAGRWVVCDRFADSTRAYQGHGMGIGDDVLTTLQRLVAGDHVPDLTVVLDLPVEEGLARAARRSAVAADRYQGLDVPFHRRVREGFLAIARQEPKRCIVIDALGDEDTVAGRIEAAVRNRFVAELAGR
jgi:dTMP kinase